MEVIEAISVKAWVVVKVNPCEGGSTVMPLEPLSQMPGVTPLEVNAPLAAAACPRTKSGKPSRHASARGVSKETHTE